MLGEIWKINMKPIDLRFCGDESHIGFLEKNPPMVLIMTIRITQKAHMGGALCYFTLAIDVLWAGISDGQLHS